MPMTTNRTKWPYGGGAVSVQPGWFPGHSKAFIYVNIGITEQGKAAPPNYSHPVVPPFQITGPNNSEYGGQFCLPQVRMPANLSLAVGDNITIQVVETAQHGAALYSVSSRVRHYEGARSLTIYTVRRRYSRRAPRRRASHTTKLLQQYRHWVQPRLHDRSFDRSRPSSCGAFDCRGHGRRSGHVRLRFRAIDFLHDENF